MSQSHTFAPPELRRQRQADVLAERLAPELSGRTVLHFGAQDGFLTAGLVKRGVDAFIRPETAMQPEVLDALDIQPRVLPGLTEPIGRRFDVVMCFGGLDNLDRLALDQTISHLARASDVIVLQYKASRVPAELRRLGFSRDFNADVSALPEGSALFRKEPVTDHQLVDAYEARLAAQIADAQAKLEAAEHHHRAELAAVKEELMVARDAALGAEALAGEAKAKQIELQRQLDALQNERGRRQMKLAEGLDKAIPEKGWELLSSAKRAVNRRRE